MAKYSRKALNEDDMTRTILDRIRGIDERVDTGKKLLKEEKEDDDNSDAGAIAITDDPMFGQNVLTNQIMSFRTSVEGGAQFSKPDEEDVASSPLIYLPDTGNLVFSGVIPCLNNLKWQFVLKTNTGDGCFTWCDKLILTKENMAILNKLYGYYLNWRESWIMESSDLEALANHIKENK